MEYTSHMKIVPDRLVFLGFGKFVRSDKITAIVPIEEDRGSGRRTLVYVEDIRDPLVASRTENTILRDMVGRRAGPSRFSESFKSRLRKFDRFSNPPSVRRRASTSTSFPGKSPTSQGTMKPAGKTLPTAFYNRDPREVAIDLLGCTLVHDADGGRASGVIVETEAYRPEDPACHAYKGPTMRNRTMFERAGLAYVYVSYGVHHLINVVCEGEGVGSAVLVRALRPVEGIGSMARRRGRSDKLCDGPGKLSQSLGVDLTLDGCDLSEGPLQIEHGEPPAGEIVSTTRIGITRAVEFPWRFVVMGERDVSVRPKVVSARNLARSATEWW